MARLNINIGTTANDRTGDPLRVAFDKANQNFIELYNLASADTQIPSQTGNNNKFLTTDGTTLRWTSISQEVGTGNVNFIGDKIYDLNGLNINNDDLIHGATAQLTLPANGSTDPVTMLNYYGAVSITTGVSPGSTKGWQFTSDGNITLPIGGDILRNGVSVLGGGASVTVNSTPPTSPTEGNLWWDTNSGRTYIYYGTSWTDANPAIPGPKGDKGDKGNPGANGTGIAPGGTTGQVLAKLNNDDYSTHWVDQTAGGSTSTLVNGSYSVSLNTSGVLTLSDNSTFSSGMFTPGASNQVIGLQSYNQRAVFDVSNAYGSRVRTWNSDRSSEYNWTFNDAGSFLLPSGGGFAHGDTGQIKVDDSNTGSLDLRDRNGRGFYTDGGGFTLRSNGTYSWHFDGNAILTLPYNNYLETTDTNLKVGSQGTVTIRSNAATGGGTKAWTFGTDGRLTIPTAPVPSHSYGVSGDKAGMLAFDSSYIYYCKQDYVDNLTDIWVRVVWTDTNW